MQESIQRKKIAKKKWESRGDEGNRQEYCEARHVARRAVARATTQAYEELYERLDSKEGGKDLYHLTKQRDGPVKDVQQVRLIKYREGNALVSVQSVLSWFKEYFEGLMNEENKSERRTNGGQIVDFMTRVFNTILKSERMSDAWRRGVLVPTCVQSCSSYRGIRLISHTFGVWERVVEARLRQEVQMSERQFGFVPRKSNTDAIFCFESAGREVRRRSEGAALCLGGSRESM